MTIENRDKILQRVLNLRAKAEDDAASEGEAMAAIERAERLMHAYRIEEAELALAEAQGHIKVDIIHKGVDSRIVNARSRNRHVALACSWSIEQLTGTEAIWIGGKVPEFTGQRADVEYAVFLQELIAMALDREYARYQRAQRIVGRGAKRAFQLSMARRINERLGEMRTENILAAQEAAKAEALRLQVDEDVIASMVTPEATAELTSTALVMLAHAEQVRAATARAYTARYPKRRTARGIGISGGMNGSAGRAGADAGSRVHLGRAIGGDGARRIG